MNPLSEESKKRLTKYMDGCAHIWVRDGHVSHHTCSECGEELSVRKEFLPKMRSFTTGNDMLDLKNKIVEKGEWNEFHEITHDNTLSTDGNFGVYDVLTEEHWSEFDNWLFSIPRFCELVGEWLEKRKEESHE